MAPLAAGMADQAAGMAATGYTDYAPQQTPLPPAAVAAPKRRAGWVALAILMLAIVAVIFAVTRSGSDDNGP
jgi:hypothetical protein